MLRRRFRAMGTDCELFLKTQPRPEALDAMTEAEWDVHRLERIFSRFDPDSELSELNRRGMLRVGPELLEVVDLALAARDRTSGRFDPTVHDALVAAGYDRTFDEVSAERRSRNPRASAAPRCAGSVRVDRRTRSIELDPGVHLDLGGIAKGYAVDRAVQILGELGPCLVDAGGDIAARGGVADRARHRRRHAHARTRRRCGRDVGPRPSPMDAWERGASPHHRPLHRIAG